MKKWIGSLFCVALLLSGCQGGTKEVSKEEHKITKEEEKEVEDKPVTIENKKLAQEKVEAFLKSLFEMKDYNRLKSNEYKEWFGGDKDFAQIMIDEVNYYTNNGKNSIRPDKTEVVSVESFDWGGEEIYYSVNLKNTYNDAELQKKFGNMALSLMQHKKRFEISDYTFTNKFDKRMFPDGYEDIEVKANDAHEQSITDFASEAVMDFFTFRKAHYNQRDEWLTKNWDAKIIPAVKKDYEAFYEEYSGESFVDVLDMNIDEYYPLPAPSDSNEKLYIVDLYPNVNGGDDYFDALYDQGIGMVVSEVNGKKTVKVMTPFCLYPWDYSLKYEGMFDEDEEAGQATEI